MPSTKNIMTFTKYGKRYRIVYAVTTKEKAERARNMYDNKITAVYHDQKKGLWYVGVRLTK